MDLPYPPPPYYAAGGVKREGEAEPQQTSSYYETVCTHTKVCLLFRLINAPPPGGEKHIIIIIIIITRPHPSASKQGPTESSSPFRGSLKPIMPGGAFFLLFSCVDSIGTPRAGGDVKSGYQDAVVRLEQSCEQIHNRRSRKRKVKFWVKAANRRENTSLP